MSLVALITLVSSLANVATWLLPDGPIRAVAVAVVAILGAVSSLSAGHASATVPPPPYGTNVGPAAPVVVEVPSGQSQGPPPDDQEGMPL